MFAVWDMAIFTQLHWVSSMKLNANKPVIIIVLARTQLCIMAEGVMNVGRVGNKQWSAAGELLNHLQLWAGMTAHNRPGDSGAATARCRQ